jgi:hypothetical protein
MSGMVWKWIRRKGEGRRKRRRSSSLTYFIAKAELMCRSVLTSAIWSPCGSRIYSGTNQGEVIIFDPLTKQVCLSLPYENFTPLQDTTNG